LVKERKEREKTNTQREVSLRRQKLGRANDLVNIWNALSDSQYSKGRPEGENGKRTGQLDERGTKDDTMDEEHRNGDGRRGELTFQCGPTLWKKGTDGRQYEDHPRGEVLYSPDPSKLLGAQKAGASRGHTRQSKARRSQTTEE